MNMSYLEILVRSEDACEAFVNLFFAGKMEINKHYTLSFDTVAEFRR